MILFEGRKENEASRTCEEGGGGRVKMTDGIDWYEWTDRVVWSAYE